MSKSRLSVAVACLFALWQTQTVLACRYNVRETGFVYFGFQSYYLFFYVNEEMDPDIVLSLETIAQTVFDNSSISCEVVRTDSQTEHPALKFLNSHQVTTMPVGILVAPDGQSLEIELKGPTQDFKQNLYAAIDRILHSPVRDETVQKSGEYYGVVLLIEGSKSEENKKAAQAIGASIEIVSKEMEFMPKIIERSPVMVTVQHESLSKEKILLWSFGLSAEQVEQPHAAVIYGKARWVGPLLKGDEITEDILFNILSVIGADCECGLDPRLIRGTILPAKWDAKLQSQAAKALGFDPENPMVKMEVSRILRLNAYQYPTADWLENETKQDLAPEGKIDDLPVPLVEDPNSEKPDPVGSVPVVRRENETEQDLAPEGEIDDLPVPLVEDPNSEKPDPVGSVPVVRRLFYVMILPLVLVLVVGVLILHRASRRSS